MRETQKSVTAFEVQQSNTRKTLKNNLGKRCVRIPRARASLWLWDYNQMPLTMVILFFLFNHSSLFAGRPLCPCTGTCLVYLNTHSDLQISICCQSRNKKRKKKRKCLLLVNSGSSFRRYHTCVTSFSPSAKSTKLKQKTQAPPSKTELKLASSKNDASCPGQQMVDGWNN